MKLSIPNSAAPGVLAQIDSGSSAIETILADVCVLATAAFALILLPGLRGSECSIRSTRDKEAASFLRSGLLLLHAPAEGTGPHRLAQMGIAPALQGLGTALILAIIQQGRDRDEQTRAAGFR